MGRCYLLRRASTTRTICNPCIIYCFLSANQSSTLTLVRSIHSVFLSFLLILFNLCISALNDFQLSGLQPYVIPIQYNNTISLLSAITLISLALIIAKLIYLILLFCLFHDEDILRFHRDTLFLIVLVWQRDGGKCDV